LLLGEKTEIAVLFWFAAKLFGWTQERKKISSANASSYLDFLIVQ